MRRRVISCIGFLLCILVVCFNLSEPMRIVRELPEYSDLAAIADALETPFSLAYKNHQITGVSSDLSESLGEASDLTDLDILLFGIIPVRQITTVKNARMVVIPGGESVGVTLYTKGALVVGLGSIAGSEGVQESPAKTAGIRAGDVVISVNDITIEDSDDFLKIYSTTQGEIKVTVERDGEDKDFMVAPVLDITDNTYKIGMWVRDSTAGVGTLSFYDPNTLQYCALGHPITDVDTGVTLNVKNGEIIKSSILGISQGENGQPGEIHGSFGSSSERLGSIEKNYEYGIYGYLYSKIENSLYPDGVLLGFPEEAQLGEATILTSIDSNGVQAFSCDVIKLYPQTEAGSKGMVINITDQRLIAQTGGIIQGMSGSPIIQNGLLIGVVTHVFVNDPLKGYCIYAYWMKESNTDTLNN